MARRLVVGGDLDGMVIHSHRTSEQSRKVPIGSIRLWLWELKESPTAVPPKGTCQRIDMPVEQYGALTLRLISFPQGATDVIKGALCARAELVPRTACV